MITDWDDAYANRPYIEGADQFIAQWTDQAQAFRQGHADKTLNLTYGDHPREVMDVFQPNSDPHGVVVFVHGGYWIDFDKSYWSHLAAGPLARGYTVMIPSYTLAPKVHIADITQQITAAVNTIARQTTGPIHLTGHSAGGHLVARLGCTDTTLEPETAERISRITPISGLPDLRPLLKTDIGKTLRLTPSEATSESPALLHPRDGLTLSCVVGALERPEFVRQNALLANIWAGFGTDTNCIETPDKHHFNIIDGLQDPQSRLCCAIIGS